MDSGYYPQISRDAVEDLSDEDDETAIDRLDVTEWSLDKWSSLNLVVLTNVSPTFRRRYSTLKGVFK